MMWCSHVPRCTKNPTFCPTWSSSSIHWNAPRRRITRRDCTSLKRPSIYNHEVEKLGSSRIYVGEELKVATLKAKSMNGNIKRTLQPDAGIRSRLEGWESRSKHWCLLMKHKGLLEVHYLPSYCSDLNPDEYLNCDLKTELSKQPERRKKGHCRPTVEKTMCMLQDATERVKSYFQAKPIQYASSKIA